MDGSSDRSERFVREVEGLRLHDPARGRPLLWLRLGVVLMVAGLAVEVVAFVLSHSTTNALSQRDAIVLAVGGVALAVVGGVLYMRFALANALRFWLARQSFDLSVQTEDLTARLADREVGSEPREAVG
jgi:uncharacterized membrane protein